MLDDVQCLLGNAVNLNYRGDFMPGRLPEIGSVIVQPTVIETTFKLIEEHTAVEERVLRDYIDRSRVI